MVGQIITYVLHVITWLKYQKIGEIMGLKLNQMIFSSKALKSVVALCS